MAAATPSERQRWLRVSLSVLSAACAVALVCAYASGGDANKPQVDSMYHMWLGSNGLPLSPRKQRALLFQFCTTNFVTEAEMRYCYARLLSVGNPSGPVKYSGQPQYDSEQVVSPLFTFAAPPMEESGSSSGDSSGGAPAQDKSTTSQQLYQGKAPSASGLRTSSSHKLTQLSETDKALARAYEQGFEAALHAREAKSRRSTAVKAPPKQMVVRPVSLGAAAESSPANEWSAFESLENNYKKMQLHAAALSKKKKHMAVKNMRLEKDHAQKHAKKAELHEGPWFSQSKDLAI